MANIWLDHHANTHNYLPAASAKKQQTQSTRKQKILGELNNKPLHLLQSADVLPAAFHSASKSLRHDVLRKQQMKQNYQQARQHLEQQFDVRPPPPTLSSRSATNNENLFDYWDVPSVCCTSSCHKTDQQIWSEANLFDDAVFDKLLNNTTGSDSDYESASDDSIVEFNRSFDMDSMLLEMQAPCLVPNDSILNMPAVELPVYSDTDCDFDDDFDF